MMPLLSRLTIRTKLYAIAVLATVAFLVVLADAAMTIHGKMLEDRMATLNVGLDAATGELTALDAGIADGSLTRDVAMRRFRAFVHSYRFNGGTGYLVVYQPNAVQIESGVDPSKNGKVSTAVDAPTGVLIAPMIVASVANSDSATVFYHYKKPNGTEPLPKTTLVRRYRPWDIVLSAGTYTDDLEADFRTTMTDMAGIAVVILLVMLAVLWAIGRDLAGGLTRMRTTMTALAGGDLAAPIAGLDRGDELGDMAKTLAVFKQNAVRVGTLQQEQAAQTARAEQDRRASRQAMAEDFERSVGNVVASVAATSGRLDAAARSMSTVARDALQAADAASSASGQASGNVQTVAAATEELTASIGEVTTRVRQCSDLARVAVERAHNTDKIVKQLFEGAQKIGDVIGLIQNIASQTNLLALNATIEAARAGDAGKGFAVVASEVKNLAGQTAKATEDIAAQIVAIQGATNGAVSAIEAVGANVEQMSEIAASIAGAVQQQDAATREIAGNAARAAGGTEAVVGNVAQMARASTAVNGASEAVQGSAVELSRQADLLRREVETFLTTVRAA
jgi:methyl-accepting chemotaxis protein